MGQRAIIIQHPSARTMHRITDIREMPIYGIAGAAFSVGISASTLRTWVLGRPFKTGGRVHWSDRLIEPADEKRGLLSFVNLAEAHVLQATREYRIPMHKVRVALDYLRNETGSRHPLLTQEFYTFQKELFIRRLIEIVNVGKGGQLAFDFLDPYLRRLVRDESGLPYRFFPMRENHESRVMVDLHIASGQPVLTGTGILAEIVYGRNIAGESAEEIARDYELDERVVIDAVRYVAAAA
jgi:uncharacterized protein (DUF433 family)